MAGGYDKRMHKRVRVSVPVEIMDVLNNKPCIGRVVDISAGGLSLLTNSEIQAETPLSLTFTVEGIIFKNVAADVVRVTRKDENFYVCVSFFNIAPLVSGHLDVLVRHIFSRTERGMQRGKLI